MPDACCSGAPSHDPGAARIGACPRCGELGKAVQRITLQSLLLVDLRSLHGEAYGFCRTPACPVAYFAGDGSQIFEADQVRVPIWHKDPAQTTPVCYCFKITPAHIQAELDATGTSTVVAQVTTGVQAGQCACEITNPQGSCCLGNVRAAVAALSQNSNEALATREGGTA